MLNDLKLKRDDQSIGAASTRNVRGIWNWLSLAAVALTISGALIWMNLDTAEKETPEGPMELASQEGRISSFEAPESPEVTGRTTKPTEPVIAPSSNQATGIPIQDPVTVLDATGYVVARRKATVSAKITGKLTGVFFEEGDQVQSGQVIALLDDSTLQAELALAEARLMSVKSRLRELKTSIDHAQRRLERSVELAERHLVSLERLDDDRLVKEGLTAKLDSLQHEIEVARRQRDVRQVQVADTRIRAPFSGVLIDKSAHPGEVVSPMSAGGGFTRTGIGTIVDMESLEVEVDINEAYLNRVFPNQAVRVSLNAYPGDGYEARVIAIVPTADRNKATVRVRIGLVEKDHRVLPNMGVRVGFVGEQTTGANQQVKSEDHYE